jgi:DNA-binding transcriptional LysR family regulator
VKTDLPDQARLLALIKRHGTLAAAAEELGITSAAVTQRLVKAERDWGVTLVSRTTRGASLTPAGAVLAPYGEVIDRQARAAADAFAAYKGETAGRLRIGTFQAAALHLLPPALTALRHRHPDADLSVVDVPSGRAIDVVADGQLDLAVFATYGAPLPIRPEVSTTHLLTDPMVIVLPDDHPLARSGTGPLRLAQLCDETWVLIRAGHVARAQFDRAAQEAGFTPHIRFESESYDVAQALVATGIGVALVSRLALSLPPGTAARPLRSPKLHREIHAVVPADRGFNQLTDSFLRLLIEVSREFGRPRPGLTTRKRA